MLSQSRRQAPGTPQPLRELDDVDGEGPLRVCILERAAAEAEHTPQLRALGGTRGEAVLGQVFDELVDFLTGDVRALGELRRSQEVLDRHHADRRQHLEQLVLKILRRIRRSGKFLHVGAEVPSISQQVVQHTMPWRRLALGAEEALRWQQGHQMLSTSGGCVRERQTFIQYPLVQKPPAPRHFALTEAARDPRDDRLAKRLFDLRRNAKTS
mmetsp:Transcript_57960/g.188527  ORF Transcript_57960/g.188527 Transcript_57960/m.188527 type:complete len:212 (-) Transcript_57960:370-1005(-)